jgi:Ca-activated chloride channel family protein
LLVDVSWSMAVEDVIPNRLGRAVEAAEQLTRAVGGDPGDRVAVVGFAGRGAVRCPLTTNLGAVVEALRSLEAGGVEPGGSDLGAGLDSAIEALDESPRSGGRIVVVFSDGEDHDPGWPRRVDRLRDLGAVVHSVAIGDGEQGHPIPVESALGQAPDEYLTDKGKVVTSRRIDTELRGLALATGGAFVPIGIARADLADLYEARIEPAERREREGRETPDRPHRYGLFLLASLAVGLIGSWPRKRRAPRARPWWTSWMLIGIASALVGAGDSGDPSPATLIAEGKTAFDRGDLDTALDRFELAAGLDPDDPIPGYNAAATLYQLGRFAEARARYLLARQGADDRLRTKIDYALGNAAVALRDIPSALRHYDDCLRSTVSGPVFDRIRAFARENRAFAEQLANPGASPADGDEGDEPSGGEDGDGDSQDDGGAGDDPQGGPDGGPGPEPPGGADRSGDGDGPGPPGGTAASAGSGTASGRPPRGNSPADRLSQAVEAIRDARDRRLPDPPPSPPAGPSERPRW